MLEFRLNMRAKKKHLNLVWVGMASGILWLGLLGFLTRDRFLTGMNDFAQLYAGATLCCTSDLYVPEASYRIHDRVFGARLESVVYVRPPFYALLLKPLTRLPYLQAYWTFECLNLLALAGFFYSFARRSSEVALFASIFPPLLASIITGQDVGLMLGLAAWGYRLREKDKPWAAGLVWSLCSIKAHLLLLVPLALLVKKDWRTLGGGLAGGALLTGVSFLAAGAQWPVDYVHLLRNPLIHPGFERMANLQSLALLLPEAAGPWVIRLGWVVLAALVVRVARAWPDWRMPFAAALVASVVGAYHAYLQDCVLLLLVLAIVLALTRDKLNRTVAAWACSPIPSLLLLAGSPWSAAMPLSLLAFLWVLGRPKPECSPQLAPSCASAPAAS